MAAVKLFSDAGRFSVMTRTAPSVATRIGASGSGADIGEAFQGWAIIH